MGTALHVKQLLEISYLYACPGGKFSMTSPLSSSLQTTLARIMLALGLPAFARRLDQRVTTDEADESESSHFVLRIVQPGLAGLMDGSVSTLAPIFATAFVSKNTFAAFLVGMASATGAGISMAFAEALSDDGALTGRGNPAVRGTITGFMTFFGGSLHTLPFLIHNINAALIAAYIVVGVELFLISAIRHRFFGTSWGLSILQVVGSGVLVFIAALIFGHA
jgi:erythrin-vacuolar iron transport family protein